MAFKGERFCQQVYYVSGGAGNLSGVSPADGKTIADGTVWMAPAGSCITSVAVVTTTTITGTTQLDVGDAGDPNGYVAAASLTADNATINNGAYLFSSVPKAKYYSSATAIALDNATTNTAGAFCVVIEGYMI